MIRVVMFDFAGTAVDEDPRVHHHLHALVDTVGSFETAGGKPLRTCIVSDTAMPARAAFEAELKRLRVRATFDECLCVAADAEHVAAARSLGMPVLRFGGTGADAFDDWSQAPALIAQRVAPESEANALVAIRAHLTARGVDVASIAPADANGRRTVSARIWRVLSGASDSQPLRVAVPVSATVDRAPNGALRTHIDMPTKEEIDEAANYARSLAAHGQIASPGAPATGEATHTLEPDESGGHKLVRRRFKAI